MEQDYYNKIRTCKLLGITSILVALIGTMAMLLVIFGDLELLQGLATVVITTPSAVLLSVLEAQTRRI